MSSIIHGFEYDVFISYRQKDNKGDRWVTEFVNALKTELEATFKEDISIYFDINPHDGLLETHDVNKSLESKLKCLIFIPIISQTYCDPKSFAWEHEFCAFNKLAEEDQFGRDIRLSGGNVASRILPIRIHDIDADDKALLEKELGGVLRAVEFVFSSPGVSRPLTATDKRDENLNKTFYRDQINKVARAIKELIVGIQHSKDTPKEERVRKKTVEKSVARKFYWAAVILLLVGLITFISYYLGGLGNKVAPGSDRSIAVLPFVNMSNDPEQEYFSDGMTEELLNQLVQIPYLRVVSRTSSMAFKGTKLQLKEIAETLGVTNIVEGSVRKSGDKVRITVQLIDTRADNHLWSQTYDRDLADVFSIQTDISKNISEELKTILDGSSAVVIQSAKTRSKEAYDYYLRGLHALNSNGKYGLAADMFTKCIEEDSTFSLAYARRAYCNAVRFLNRFKGWEVLDSGAWRDLEIARRLAPGQIEVSLTEAYLWYSTRREYGKAITILEELKSQYPNNSELWSDLRSVQRRLGMFREAIESGEKALSLDRNNETMMYESGRTYAAVRNYEKAIEYFDRAQYSNAAGWARLRWTGDFSKLPREMNLYFRREFDSAATYCESLDPAHWEYEGGLHWKYLLLARLNYFMHPAMSIKYAEKAEMMIKERLQSLPNDYTYLADLALAKAWMRKKDEALDLARKACTLMPYGKDPMVDGVLNEVNLLNVYLINGQHDLAMDMMESLLSKPGEWTISSAMLRVDPIYDNLRSLPRFQKILATEYKTIY